MKKESYGKSWRREYRKVNGKTKPVMVKGKGKTEVVKVPSEGYVRKHHPQGPWDS